MAAPVLDFVASFAKRELPSQEDDPNIGNARGGTRTKGGEAMESVGMGGGTSGSALLSTFVPALVFALVWFALFLIFRRTQHRFYAPKSYLGHIHDYERTPEMPKGWLNWFADFWRLPDSTVLRHSSLDGYLLLRFLKLMSLVCLVGCLITWPILFPINITGGGGNAELDMLSFSNVADTTRYYAHALVSGIFFAFIFYMVTRECIFYASLRQVYLLSPLYANRISSRTVLFMSVPRSLLDKAKLSGIFGGSVRRIWITTDTKKLEELVAKRNSLAYRLEEAETSFIKSANKARAKSIKAEAKSRESGLQETRESGGNNDADTGASCSWALKVKRPTHRLRYFTGEKVDTIDWLRAELAKVIPQVKELQQKHREGNEKKVSAVFVEFNTQTDAQIAFQTLPHHHPFRMTPRYVGIPPEQVVWSALRYTWWQRIIRKFAIQAFITTLIIFWSIPSAFVGMITNITYLTDLIPFLKFIDDLPSVIKGVLTGLLPAAALSALMMLVPFILRWCARQSGLPSRARVELFTQNAHFCFQVVQVFLITTLTSAASAATTQIIKDPLSAKDLLAENLPKASNFYLSFFLFQGLVLSAVAVVQVIAFLAYKTLRVMFDKTPRKHYERWARLTRVHWGTVFPVFTNMSVIAITYSCIAPLILIFASFALFLVYQAYRYNLLFVYDSPVDTKGMIYPRALKHVLTGIYLAEVCMIGLFAIRTAIGPLIIMVIFTITTTLAHISLNDALRPLLNALPRSLDKPEEDQDGLSGLSNDEGPKGGAEYSEKQDEASSSTSTEDSNKAKETTVSRAVTTCTTAEEYRPTRRRKLASLADWILKPTIFTDYVVLKKKMRRETGIIYDEDVAENAFYQPAVKSPPPLLWVPKDPGGVSQQEVEQTRDVIPITDEEAHLNEKNKVIWDKIGMKPPIWQEKIFY